MVRLEAKGDFKKTQKWLNKLLNDRFMKKLSEYGQRGVEALSAATPVDTGLTASSWAYEIDFSDEGFVLKWKNTNVKDGWFNVALALQYGHGTGTGGWVEGRDYINPAIQPIFDEMIRDFKMEITENG